MHIGTRLHTGKTITPRKMLTRRTTIRITTTAPLMARLVTALNLLMALRLTEADILAIEAIMQTTALIVAIRALDPTSTIMGPRSVVQEQTSATFNGLHLGLAAAVAGIALRPCTAVGRRLLRRDHRL